MDRVEHVLSARCELGEGPVWHAEEGALWFTDILGRRLHRYMPDSGEHHIYELGVRVGSFSIRSAGGFVLAAENGFAFWDTEDEAPQFISRFDEFGEADRFNDGKTDPLGRFWAGAMSKAGDGRLYCLAPDGSIQVKENRISISNGLGWSPDYTRMYYTDTHTRSISIYDYDLETGHISNRRPFVQVPAGTGYPDGLAVDAEGCVWSAMWGGWRVVRYTPDGKLDREIRLPVERVSSCVFGGPELDELYITTAQEGMDAEERRRQPLAGDLFRVKTGVKGLPLFMYAG